MKIIIGLGNPEEKYTSTRHNVGFVMLDHYAQKNGVTFQAKDKFRAYIAELSVQDEKILLVKPTTYYNLSGEAARAIADYYKVHPTDVLIIHDELALPFGTVRTRLGGSDAGNNGIKSINEHLGPSTPRIRIGIYNELRDRINDMDFVLGRFSFQENSLLEDLTDKVSDIVDDFIRGNFETTTHK